MKASYKLANDIWSHFPRGCIALALNRPDLVLGLIVGKDINPTITITGSCLVDDRQTHIRKRCRNVFFKIEPSGTRSGWRLCQRTVENGGSRTASVKALTLLHSSISPPMWADERIPARNTKAVTHRQS